MKLRTLACLIGAIAISSAPFVLAVSGGGFPSQPTFQTVNNGGAGSVSCSGSGTVFCSNESSTNAWAGVFSSTAASGNQRGLLASLPASGSGDTAFRVNVNGGTTAFGVDGAGNVSLPGGTGTFSMSRSAGNSSLLELAGNGTTQGVSSVAVGSDAGGVAQFVNRNSGANANVGCTGTCTLSLTASTITTSAGTVPWVTQTTATTTPTVTAGCTTTPGVTFRFVKIGSTVTIETDGFSCTSNATTMFIPGTLPSAAYEPAHQTSCMLIGVDSGKTGITPVFLNFNTASTEVDPQVALATSNQWTASGTKGLSASSCSYSLL